MSDLYQHAIRLCLHMALDARTLCNRLFFAALASLPVLNLGVVAQRSGAKLALYCIEGYEGQ